MSWFLIISVTFFIVMLSAFPWQRHVEAQWQSSPIHMFLHANRSFSVFKPSQCFNFPRRRLDSLAICIRLLDVKKSVATIFVYPQNSSSNLKNKNTKRMLHVIHVSSFFKFFIVMETTNNILSYQLSNPFSANLPAI